MGGTLSARTLVVGLGSIGRRHLANLIELGIEVAVCRRPGQAAAEELDVPVFFGLEQAGAWEPEAVIVANPTSEHVATARWAVERGCHVLVEKPLSHTLEGVDELLEDAASRGLCLAVACNLRFHPALEAIKAAVDAGRLGTLLSVRAEVGRYLPDWQPERDYRSSYAARAELGGGALLTLVHELDYVIWIAGRIGRSAGMKATVSQLELDVDDVAEVVCEHAAGTLSSVHMDLLDRSYNRRSRWVGSAATIEWRWGEPVVLGDETLWEDPHFDMNSTYLAELDDFLACLASGGAPRTTGEDARHALEVATTVLA